VETSGAVGESAMDIIQELGRRITNTTAVQRSFMFPYTRFQRIRDLVIIVLYKSTLYLNLPSDAASQRGNAVCITGTPPSSPSLDNEVILLS